MQTLKQRMNRKGLSILLILLLNTFTIWAVNGANITMNISQKPISSVLSEIEKKSEYKFFYNSNLKGLDQLVSLSVKNADIRTVMDRLLNRTEIGYSFEKNNVILLFLKERIMKSSSKEAPLIGSIMDEKSGESIIGANVRIKGTSLGTVTNIDGKFSLSNVPDNSVLEISYLGYEKLEMPIRDRAYLTIRLKKNQTELNDVVVVGYGSQKKVNLTGAVSVIKAKDLNGRPSINTATVLQGADPGLNIAMSSGGPSSGYSVNIRGVASINGGSPLILVDGVEMSLSRINANDIESISILKDASAAAIYGAKASSGVVLITTKSGSAGSKPIVTFDSNFGWKKNTTSTDFITSGYWSAYINDMFMYNHAGYNYTTYSDADYAELWMRLGQNTETKERPWTVVQNNSSYKYYANYNWYDHYFQANRPVEDYNVSVRGGNDKINYYVSGRSYKEEGIMAQNTDIWKNISTRAKLNIKIFPWMRYGLNYSFYNSDYTYPGTNSVAEIFRVTGLHALAFIPSTNPDGTSVYMNSYTNASATVSDGYNAVLNHGKHFNEERYRETLVKNSLEIDVLKNMTISGDYSFDWLYKDYQSRRTAVPYSQYEGIISYMQNTTARDQYNQNFYRYTTDNYNVYGTYSPKIGNNNFKIMGGYNGVIYHQRGLSVERYGLLTEELNSFNLATGEVSTLKEEINNYVTQGWFGRFNYDYAGKYLLEFSGRYDGTSRFEKDHRWGFFPSASAGWRMSEENFWKPLSSWWNNAKIRASVGSLGNQQVGYYSYIQSISTGNTLSGYTLDGSNLLTYATEDDPVAGNLTWETVTTYDMGLDLSFLKNRLTITADGYIRDTKGMLTSGMSLPAVYGADVPDMNCANLRTKGWELYTQWNDRFYLLSKRFNYSIGFGIGDYKTKITKFDNPTKILTDYYEGETLGEIWGYSVGGLFATDAEAAGYDVNQSYLNSDINVSLVDKGVHAGDVKYLDLDGDKVISIGSNTADDPGDRRVIGNSLPRYSYNIRLGGDWNNFDFSVFFQGVGKRDWYPSTEATTFWGPYSRPYQAYISSGFLNNVWSESNPNAYFPRPRAYEALGTTNSLGSANDRYLQSIAYLRLKNLSVGYAIPVCKKVFQEVRVFFSGENLYYWSPLKKYCKTIDPESANALNTGITYSFAKTYTFGVSIEL